MIILSVGMPRAGSGWYYNLTNDLMLAGGAQDARRIRTRFRLQKVLTEVNCNIGALTPPRLLAVLVPALLGNTFVVKAHAGPTPLASALIRLGWVRAAYIYRDPRDALLSAYENGERARREGRSNAFSALVDFEAALRFMQDYVRISDAWLNHGRVLHTRYEDLLLDYDSEARRLLEFLPVAAQAPGLGEVMERYRPEGAQGGQKGLHFSRGLVGRFRQKFELPQQEAMAQAFDSYLKRVGYPV